MSIAAVILAAGASTRMGSPKALLQHGGIRFLDRLVDLARGANMGPIITVEGPHSLPDLPGVCKVVHPRWANGQITSIQAGLAALDPQTVSGVLLLTVDRPHLRPKTISQLLSAAKVEDWDVLQPQHAGRHGHPIVLHRRTFATVASLRADASLRDVVRRSRRRFVEVDDDPAIFENLDSPADLARLPRNW